MTSMILCESIHSKPSDSLIHIVLIDNQSPLEQAKSNGSKKKNWVRKCPIQRILVIEEDELTI
jgi:hypothetical protein